MEGNGLCSGRWTYYAGENATGKIEFGVPNPNPSGLNTSSKVAKFTKDTTCFEYMGASCDMAVPFDLSSTSVFKMLVYSTTTDEIMFKLQPGTNYAKAVYFTYKVSRINQWEEATFNFQSVKQRTDFNRVEIHYIDGKKANGILYFDLVQAPNPVGITLEKTSIAMGQENGAVIRANLTNAIFKPSLTTANWIATDLPPGVNIDSVQRLNDTTANIILRDNSSANYSRRVLQLSVSAAEVITTNTDRYTARGNVVFEGNPAWTLVFNDEFNGSGLPDRTKWTVDPKPKAWINGEQQVYTDTTRDNIRVENGNLIITGKQDYPTSNSNEPWSSGRLISQGKMDFLYGRVEVRAKLPKARGSWPAIWMMPTVSTYGGWPKSGEIDIMEHVGNNFGTVLSTVHTENNNWTNGGHLSGTRKLMDAATDFHVYAVDWTPDSLRFMYDSIPVYSYANPNTDWKDWPFDQKFHIILNLAIGGGMGGAITAADWPDSMTVDYVRVYQKGLGTPMLDTIVVTPANQSFLSGATQQYKAVAYDQNSHIMAITPTWSITGTGNTITSTGLATIQSSGIVQVTATVDSVTVTSSTRVNARATNYKPIPVKIEAEQFDNANACCTEPTSDIGGGQNISYIGTGTWMEYDIAVPSPGDYRIQFRVAVNTASSLKVLLDTAVLTTVALPASGGWQKWITVTTLPITFTGGNKTIRVYSNADGWNFNWLQFVHADAVRPTRIVITPDSVRLNTTTTKQFRATGYTADSSVIAILPTWNTTSAGSTINAQGLFTAGNITGAGLVTVTSDSITATAKVNITPIPVLTRLAITPDTVTVPVGASQQFVLTGYDQLDNIMSVPTPVWTVSGTGNSINQFGLLTAGTSPGTFTVTATAGSLTASTVVTLAYTCTVNNKYEAESASARASRPYLETCTDIGGGLNFTGMYSTDWFAYNNLSVPATGLYTVSFRVSTTAPARLHVGHSSLNFGTVNIPSTGGTWQTITTTMVLPALTYTGIHVDAGTLKFNWFNIDNCAHAPDSGSTMARLAVTHPNTNAATASTVIYPNPTKGDITIQLSPGTYNMMTLLDINGKVIRRWRIAAGDQRIHKQLDFLRNGVYIIRLQGDKEQESLKVIKQE
jgi:beta-glucanase (GH16 family)